MCILIHHPINTQFAVEQLQDFYNKNPDGFGAIVKHGDTVEVIKSVGKIDEIIELYQTQVSGREAVIHFRMKTHGDIDLANCHPYEVVPGIWLAHNGILSTGNAADPRMSDTWHYIQDFLKPMLEHDPSMLFNQGFQKMIASHISGSNKFGFMTQEGEVVIINKDLGVEHKGVWYSNTYAWTPWKFGFGHPPLHTTSTYQRSLAFDQSAKWDSRYASSASWKQWDAFDRQIEAEKRAEPSKRKAKKRLDLDKIKHVDTNVLKRIIRSSYNAINLEGYKSMMQWVEMYPMAAMQLIYEVYGNERSKSSNARAISDMVNQNPGEAADWLCDIWESMEPDLCELADIQMQGVNHDL